MNFINNKKRRILNRKKHMDESVWLIGKKKNGKEYYIYELDTNYTRIVWTSIVSESMMFHHEKGAQAFVREHLIPTHSRDLFIRYVDDPKIPPKRNIIKR